MSKKITFDVKFVCVDFPKYPSPKYGVIDDMIWDYFGGKNQTSTFVQCTVCGRKLRSNIKTNLQNHLKTHETSWKEFLDKISVELNIISSSSAYKGQEL